jgi:hypothetical protein
LAPILCSDLFNGAIAIATINANPLHIPPVGWVIASDSGDNPPSTNRGVLFALVKVTGPNRRGIGDWRYLTTYRAGGGILDICDTNSTWQCADRKRQK